VTTTLESYVILYIIEHQRQTYSMPHLSYILDWEFDIIFIRILKRRLVMTLTQFPDSCDFSKNCYYFGIQLDK
jgi:hypothetical protein